MLYCTLVCVFYVFYVCILSLPSGVINNNNNNNNNNNRPYPELDLGPTRVYRRSRCCCCCSPLSGVWSDLPVMRVP